MSSESADDLPALRGQLDAVDAVLLEAVRERLEICLRIGEYKRVHGVPMMQPQRIAAVQERAARFARRHGIDPGFLHRLYDVVIAETCRLEDEWIAGGGPERRAS
ncbi:chorismate mutase family protein [Streptomyces pseudogriseolus]|uniref:chorismate mutase family protein n=1 Tax=Streptomyces pseudogriseolus TaxID=36817 RepID=UPI003FA294BE